MTLKIQHVVKQYGHLVVLKDISLDIESGEFVCFLGPSGCGKTTLLRIIAGLEQAESGQVLLDGNDLSRVPAVTRKFGMVFQSYSLFPNMTALRNVGYGLECRGRPKAEIRERAEAMLRLVSLADQAHKLPAQMSGGQQQRIALARALAIDPALLLLDEPLSALDAKVREGLRTEIRDLQRRLGITTIMVTHDQEEALTMADKIVVMRDGQVEQVGTPGELYRRPATPFVASFLGRMNFLSPALGAALQVPGKGPVGVRPEDVTLCGAGDGGAVAGTVREVIYLGNITRVVVEPDAAPAELMMAECHAAEASIAIGSRIGLRIAPEALRVLQ